MLKSIKIKVSAEDPVSERSENFSYREWKCFFVLKFPTLMTVGAIIKAKERKA